jgi:hypothetical protein
MFPDSSEVHVWRTAPEEIHSVHVNRPEVLFEERTLGAILAVLDELNGDIQDQFISDAIDACVEAIRCTVYDELAEVAFVEQVPPSGLCDFYLLDLSQLTEELAAIGTRWRLDIVLALDELMARAK